ncbi:MAG: tetratricopeptide repeat protein, partial [Acidobacteria bacterium]|nr:tetratricopeptide repeat protein [Acidobacteriota bacterium]
MSEPLCLAREEQRKTTGDWRRVALAALLCLGLAASSAARQDRIAAGAAALQRGDTAAAREAFQAAVRADESSAVAWLGLSSAAQMEGDLTGALAAARRAAILAPERAEAQLALGRMLGRTGRTEEALAVFARTRELAP